MSKYDSLNVFVLELLAKGINVELIALQEIWNVEFPDLLDIEGFQPLIYKQRTNMRGGGVGFYVKNNINFEIVENCSHFESKVFESLTLLLSKQNNEKMYVTSLYRSNGPLPNFTANEKRKKFDDAFDSLLSNLSEKSHQSFIFADSNINLLSNNNDVYMDYLNAMFANGFLQICNKATRMQGPSSSLIDHIITNCTYHSFVSGSIVSDISDHFPTFICLQKNRSRKSAKEITSRLFTIDKINAFKFLLSNANWQYVLDKLDVNTAYESFWDIYKNNFESTFPLTKVKFNRNIHKKTGFITAGLLISRGTKLSLHKQSLINPTFAAINQYKQFRNIYTKTLRAAKKLHILNLLKENKGNAKKTWEILNECIGRKSKNAKISKININGLPNEIPLDIANEFNSFFASVGKNISESVPHVSKSPEAYLDPIPNVPELNLQNVTPEYITKIVKSLAAKSSMDMDGVSSKMIKCIVNEIAVPLSHIFNLSLSSGVFPTKLKVSRVIPIYKSGNVLECDNYRPISLLSSISKVLEKIVAKKLLLHLQSNNLIYNYQFGFLPERSTEQNLLQVTNYITTALNEGMFCVGVFIDLRKAFDVCSHDILLKKLRGLGIVNNAYNWFCSYLSNRTQCVDIQGEISDEKSLDISVIQGSILGTILFLCYINDFYKCTTLFSILFADDGSCLAKNKNLADLIWYVNNELQKIANWFHSNKMAVNTTKTKYIIFRTHGKPINDNICKIIFNNNEINTPNLPDNMFQIERIHNEGETKSFKLLGVLFDEYLTFDSHTKFVCSKISKSIYIINRAKNFLPKSALLSLYYALVHSHLTYCISIYGCANKTSLNKIFLKQKKAVRLITNANFRAHTAEIFSFLKILPLDKMILFSKAKFMHKFAFRRLPESFSECWLKNSERMPGRLLRNADDLYIYPHRYESIKRLPFFSFPTVWNQEDDSKLNPNAKVFQKQLKKKLLNSILA
jgi:hypothetical protein